VRRVKKLFLAT